MDVPPPRFREDDEVRERVMQAIAASTLNKQVSFNRSTDTSTTAVQYIDAVGHNILCLLYVS